MRYRKRSTTGDYLFGHGADDFHIDIADGIGQAVETRLQLRIGEWFLDITDGTDWDGRVLGTNTAMSRDIELRSRVAGTPGVNAILGFATKLDENTRTYTAHIAIDTVYGTYTWTLD